VKSSSRKILIAFAISLSVLAIASMAYFIVVPEKEITAENKPVAAIHQLKSFRGVLVGALLDVKEKSVQIEEKISEAVPNPFASAKNVSTKASGQDSFSFAILGDTQYFDAENPRGNFQKAMESMSKSNPDLVLAVGDLVGNCDGDDKCAKKYSDWKKILGALLPKTYAAQGNHDRAGNDKTDNVWRSSFDFPTNGPPGFSEQAYSFDYKNSHFVVLDSDRPKEHLVNGEERNWLEKDLSANKKENTFVFFHEPAYPVSSKIGESLDTDPSERNALWKILEKYNVTAVFNGHEHIVSRRKIDGIYQFVFGNTDSFNHDLPKTGVAEYASQIQGSSGLVKVNGKEITVETHGPDGIILNSFSFSK
jgi:3',5'-cyclic-AMP phosphodiesterase